MLGTPPAFVLSQDQTLKKLYLKAEALKSNHLNNLSSKYTQEFSLAVIRFKTLKQSIYCQGVHFVFALFNLQGTDRVTALAVSLLILPRHVLLVKKFFSKNQHFFTWLPAPPLGSA